MYSTKIRTYYLRLLDMTAHHQIVKAAIVAGAIGIAGASNAAPIT
jgi:hypothetical protein